MRRELPDRRPSVTEVVQWMTESGREQALHITYGFKCFSDRSVREVFIASTRRAGSDLDAIAADGCVMMSRLMQHGYSAKQVRDMLCPTSLIWAIANAAARIDEEMSSEPIIVLRKDPEDDHPEDEAVPIPPPPPAPSSEAASVGASA